MQINDGYIEYVPNKGKEFYQWWKDIPPMPYDEYIQKFWPASHKIGWGSHQPVILHMLNCVPEGRVLEFGMGPFSTPLMSIICEKQQRKLLSIDNNRKYFGPMMHYPGIKFVFMDRKIIEGSYKFFGKKFAIAFVDAHPPELRQIFINRMKANVDYFIVHDTENPEPYQYDFTGFKHVLQFEHANPKTSVLSDLDVIDERILEIFK